MDGFKKNWYREWFGEDYLTVYSHRNDPDARALIRLILKNIPLSTQASVLDLGCGNGRHAFALAPHVAHVSGLDLSEHLLREAQKRKRAQKNGNNTDFIRGDMRTLPFRTSFDAVLSLFTSFGYFDDDKEHQQVANGMAAVLKPGGFLVLDYLNAGYVRLHLQPTGQRDVDGMRVDEKRWIDKGRVFKKISLRSRGEERVFYESVRLFSMEEMIQILKKAQIRVMHIFGDYNGEACSATSKRMIFIGKKENEE